MATEGLWLSLSQLNPECTWNHQPSHNTTATIIRRSLPRHHTTTVISHHSLCYLTVPSSPAYHHRPNSQLSNASWNGASNDYSISQPWVPVPGPAPSLPSGSWWQRSSITINWLIFLVNLLLFSSDFPYLPTFHPSLTVCEQSIGSLVLGLEKNISTFWHWIDILYNVYWQNNSAGTMYTDTAAAACTTMHGICQ